MPVEAVAAGTVGVWTPSAAVTSGEALSPADVAVVAAARRRGRARLLAVLVRVRGDVLDVVLRLRVGRDAVVLLHGAGAGVVGRERLGDVAAEAVELLLEVLRAALDVLHRVARVRDAEAGGRGGHELRESHRACGRLGVRVEVRLLADEPAEERGVDAVACGRRVDLGGERRRGAGRGGRAGRGRRRSRVGRGLQRRGERGGRRGGRRRRRLRPDGRQRGHHGLDLLDPVEGDSGAHICSRRRWMASAISSSADAARCASAA